MHEPQNPFTNLQEQLSNTTTLIKPDCFPMPDRADTFARPLSEADATALTKRREFATRQAEEANTELTTLCELKTVPTANDWANVYNSITQWRSGLDAARLGQGVTQSRDRYHYAYHGQVTKPR